MVSYAAGAGASLLPLLAHAQFTAPRVSQFETLTGFQNFICTVIVNWLFTFLILLVVVFVLLAAFKYLTASGDPERVKSASSMVMYAGVAVVAALLARGLPFLVGSLFGAGGFGC